MPEENEITDDRSVRGNIQRLWEWAKAHKGKAVLAGLGVFVVGELLSIPWFSVADLKTENPTETALMRQRVREGERDDTHLVVRQRWIPLSKLPRHLINAVVVAEDGMFWEHGGFDWYEFQESLRKNWEKKRAVRGASTITQQLAKNLYLSTSKDPIRKVKEWLITLLLEKNLDKERILEIYVNVIEWGRGVFGVEEAARIYFGRSASSLTYDQAIRLAAVIPSPLKHKPTDYSRWVMFRRKLVAQRMAGRKYDNTEPEPDEDELEQTQSKETPSSPDTVMQPPVGSGKLPDDETIRRDAMPTDSTDIGRGNDHDIQRREPID